MCRPCVDSAYFLFSVRFNDLKGCGDTYYIVVIEDMSLNQVIGTGSLVKERKFLRQCASVSIRKI